MKRRNQTSGRCAKTRLSREALENKAQWDCLKWGKAWRKREHLRKTIEASLAVQWLRLGLPIQAVQIWSLVRRLRSHKPHSQKKKNLKWTEFVLNVFSEKQIADQPEFFLESDIKINVILSWIIIVTKLHFPFSLDLRKESKSVDRLKLKKALS